ncbi:MAG: hypothetical protein UZ12_BCD005001180 [Bacteroidetes bacterium OLB12]|nr:MAG: hypothetical protein UZ12_BCD005001180 [Bacteroidetes bacterium OLB12]
MKLTGFIICYAFTLAAWAQPPAMPDSTLVTPDSTYSDSLNIKYFDDEQEPDFAGPADTVAVSAQQFSSQKIDSLKADEELKYTQPPTVAESIWQRIKRWLSWLFRSLFEKTTTTDLGRFIMYSIIIVAIVIIVMTLLRVNAFRVFYSGADTTKPAYSVFHENIHEMNFDLLIQEAVDKKEFRLATRLIFLQALKLLSDKHLIDFTPGKTNHDYVEELKSGEVKTGLNELSFYFEYAWYGNFSITEGQFQQVKQTFSFWKEKVQ